MCEISPFESVHTLWTDRESTFTSPRFRKLILERFGVRFQFLHYRHKSFFAERAIRTLKERLFAVMKLKKTKRWHGDLLKNTVAKYNRGKSHGTSFRRVDISSRNWGSFLKEYLDVPHPDHALIARSGDGDILEA